MASYFKKDKVEKSVFEFSLKSKPKIMCKT